MKNLNLFWMRSNQMGKAPGCDVIMAEMAKQEKIAPALSLCPKIGKMEFGLRIGNCIPFAEEEQSKSVFVHNYSCKSCTQDTVTNCIVLKRIEGKWNKN